VAGEDRSRFYPTLNARGWKVREPGGEELAPERPELVARIGTVMRERGLTDAEIARLAGFAPDSDDNPFRSSVPRLRAV
jgi:hypothetical protein